MSDDYVKKAAEYMKMGARMLSESCPICKLPLFKLGEDVVCLNCGKKIILVKEDKEAVAAKTPLILTDIEESLVTKILEVKRKLMLAEDLDDMKKAGDVLNTLLEALSTIRKLRKS